MAPPPPAVLAAGIAGEAASHCSRFFESPGEGVSPPRRTWWAKRRGSCSRGEPSLSAAAGLRCGPCLRGRGPSLPAAPLRRRAEWNAGFFFGLSPRLRGLVSAPWGWGRGTLCKQPVFPPGGLESGFLCAGATPGRGSLQAAGRPRLAPHIPGVPPPAPEYLLLLSKAASLPGGAVGGGGVSGFLMEASRFEPCGFC